ncbi:hypothetical protein AB8P51_02040 [Muriicola sp. SD30]|uniref:tetratricopeptide repeat protein n=1 Tax=Muriicola sp. SD30 TaxID=3240936 RepID=UPI00351024F0
MSVNSIKKEKIIAIPTLMKRLLLVCGGILSMHLITSCKQENAYIPATPPPFITPLGKVYQRNIASGKALEDFQQARIAYLKDTTDVDLLIWYGRRTAYLGNYEDAIAVYSNGIRRFPEDARLYRHRGHRYISIREFDKAIADLEKGAELIHGTENVIEPDGMPNAMNIPVSTLHGNIWYHLGLAYYLKHDYNNAYRAYLNCRESGSNPDNLVSSTHWLYMIQRRLGNKTLADSLLIPIKTGLEVIENTNYYDLCKFYKGLIPVDSLTKAKEMSAASDAVSYGLANWYYHEGMGEEAIEIWLDITERDSWTSFGYIAAESDLSNITIRK